MLYLVQAKEEEIGYELLQQLAAVMAEAKEVTYADATYRIRSSYGVLGVEQKEEALRISRRFDELGFRHFVMEELLEPPAAVDLDLAASDFGQEVDLAAAAKLRLVTERTVRDINPLRMRVAYPRIPIPSSAVEERTVRRQDTRYYLDLFTPYEHWRVRTGSVVRIEEQLSKISMRRPLLGEGVRKLARGDRNIITFRSERDYDKYLKWLYQLKYAAR